MGGGEGSDFDLGSWEEDFLIFLVVWDFEVLDSSLLSFCYDFFGPIKIIIID